jgi:hypothetical protein
MIYSLQSSSILEQFVGRILHEPSSSANRNRVGLSRAHLRLTPKKRLPPGGRVVIGVILLEIPSGFTQNFSDLGADERSPIPEPLESISGHMSLPSSARQTSAAYLAPVPLHPDLHFIKSISVPWKLQNLINNLDLRSQSRSLIHGSSLRKS